MKKFVPATSAPLSTGYVRGMWFNVVVSRKSGFDGFEQFSDLPCLHLSVAAQEEDVTWARLEEKRCPIGLVLDQIVLKMPEIIAHFFGNALAFDQAAWRIELNSPLAARRQTAHFHLEVGHKDLFGESGYARQCVHSLLKPDLIIERMQASVRALIEADDAHTHL